MRTLSIICCSVLRRELEAFASQHYPDAELVFLDSMLHMHPEKLGLIIDAALSVRPDRDCLLVYGDCHAHMQETVRRPHCARTNSVNCGELLLGRDKYRSFRNQKVFLFLPEWTERWREVFIKELGFSDRSLAREFMQESQRRLVYLDTGVIPVPEKTLKDVADHFGMPVDVLAVSLDELYQAVRLAIQHLQTPDSHDA
jgi:hypothetical protein